MNESRNWALPMLAAGQAQKEVTHNEALMAVDRLLHLVVVTRTLSAPPDTAATGDSYIIGDAPTGGWADNAAGLATFDGGGWLVTRPRTGCLAWVADENQFVVFSDAGWSVGGWPAKGLSVDGRTMLAALPVEISAPASGVTVDIECRAALSALLVALVDQGVIKQSRGA